MKYSGLRNFASCPFSRARAGGSLHWRGAAELGGHNQAVCVSLLRFPPPPFNAQEKNEIRLLNVMNKKKILLLPCFIGVNN